jgi:hypothetical protein
MIKVTKIKHLGGYRLHATFSDGTAGERDFSALVTETGPMVEPLRDPAYFARVPGRWRADLAEWIRYVPGLAAPGDRGDGRAYSRCDGVVDARNACSL